MISNELLKQKILDSAIRGELVENDLSLPPVDVEEIKEDIPFDIPNNWKWSRLENLGIITSSKRVFQNEWKNEGVPFYRARDIVSLNKGLSTSELYISEEMYKEYSKNYGIPEKGDILLTGVGTIGESYIVKENDKFYFKDGNIIWLKKLCDVDSMYLKKYFESNLFKNQVYQTAKGATVLTLTIVHAKEILIPLPPLEEQEKIVKKIEELFDLIDKKEKNDKEKEKLRILLKEKILDSAIRGELVENDLSLSAIDVKEIKEDVPYNIPNNWKWTKFDYLATIVRGGSPRPIKDYLTDAHEGINWIKIGDTSPNSYFINNVKEKIKPEGVKKSRFVEKGSLLLSNSMSFGRPYILNVEGCIHDGWLNIKCKNNYFYNIYILYLLSSKYFYNIMSNKSSGSVVSNLNIDKVKELVVPIPPLEQQKKIVEKIEKCFELIEQL